MMEAKSQSLTVIFLIVFAAGLVLGFADGYRMMLPLFLRTQEMPLVTIGFYMSILSLIGFVVSPVLILIGMYLAGRKFDLKSKLGPTIITLIIGAYAGNAGGRFISLLIAPGLNEIQLEIIRSSLASLSFIQLFFPALAALAIAYIRHAHANQP